MSTNATWLFVKDEFIGFAKSRAMLVLWIVIPLVALAGFMLISGQIKVDNERAMGATEFMTMLETSLAGTVAALMIAVDLVSERNRNVYVLFAVRPFRREVIIYAKFLAVVICVSAACIISIMLGITADALRGNPVTSSTFSGAGRAFLTLTLTISISAAGGVMAGVMARSIVVAVLLVLYLWQNFALIPNIPLYFGVKPSWLYDAIPMALTALFVLGGARMFRRAEL